MYKSRFDYETAYLGIRTLLEKYVEEMSVRVPGDELSEAAKKLEKEIERRLRDDKPPEQKPHTRWIPRKLF